MRKLNISKLSNVVIIINPFHGATAGADICLVLKNQIVTKLNRSKHSLELISSTLIGQKRSNIDFHSPSFRRYVSMR